MKETDSEIKFSIKIKFIVGIALLVGLIILLNSINTSYRESDLLTASMNQSGQLLSSTLAIACQDPIISQQYDAFVPYTERIIAGGQDVQEISILDIDGIYLAHRSREDATDSKLGQKASEEIIKRLDSIDKFAQIPTKDGKFVDYISSIRVGTSKFGSVILRYSYDSLAENKADRKSVV